MSRSKTVLWHIPISHYNEKARWALEYKGIDHKRRAVPPPAHMAAAYAITRGRGYTLPLLQLNGQAIGDSTEIIAALETHQPEPALYPADRDDRERALALEDFFDEELGPHTRLLGFHEMRSEPDKMAQVAGSMLPGNLGQNERVANAAGQMGKAFAAVRYGSDSEVDADAARKKIVAAFDRLEGELDRGAGDYLVGDAFSVADLTAACLFVPVVRPDGAPQLPEPPEHYEEFLAPLRGRRGWAWVGETFARHR